MAAPTVTYTFTNSTTADATEVNQNFTDIIDALTDGTSDFSFGSATLSGSLTANGNVTVGNATTDDFTVNASLASSIPVKTADTYDIGSAALGLNAIYFGDNSNSVGVKADASASADWVFSFPPASGSNGQVMQTSGSGATIWVPGQTDINAVSSANYTVTDTDGYKHINVTTGSSDRTITLPTAADNTDRTLVIRKVDGGSGKVIVDGEGSETINGATTYNVLLQYSYVRLVCDGSEWFVDDENFGKFRSNVQYTPSSSNGLGTPTFRLEWFRQGSCVVILGDFDAGTTTASEARIELPGSFTIDFQNSTGACVVGHYARGNASGNNNGTVLATDGDTYINFGKYDPSSPASLITPVNGNDIFGTGNRISFYCTIPVSDFALS